MVERLSLRDESLISSHADHLQRYGFALPYCRGKDVFDAGCGIGYGSHFLASNGAARVTAVDISEDALSEARQSFQRDNLVFERCDVERLDQKKAEFDVVVNFENLEHLQHAEKLVEGVARCLKPGGVFITSTPNGAISNSGPDGHLANEYHVKEFSLDELQALLKPHFRSISLFGQWITYAGQLRKVRARQTFDTLNELYFNPMSRIGRIIAGALGKRSIGPPQFFAADGFTGDYEIKPIETRPYPWEPIVLIAICKDVD